MQRLIFATLFVSLILPASAATSLTQADLVYKDTGFDADDIPRDQGEEMGVRDPDIRSTTRKITLEDAGGRTLSIAVTTYEYFYGYWRIVVRLDSRGGPRADARMIIRDDGGGFERCRVRFLSSGEAHLGELRFPGEPPSYERVVCGAPLRWVHPNKRIRWTLISRAAGNGIDEYAPSDHTWYP